MAGHSHSPDGIYQHRSIVAVFAATAANGPPDPGCPRPFDRYMLLRQIDEGGFGEIYLAHENDSFALVAIKILSRRRSDPASLERFRQEARIGLTLAHPNILPVIRSGEFEGQHFLVMPFIDGPNLRRLIGKRPLAAEHAVSILLPITEALQHVHDADYLHRDIKPENILIERAGGRPLIGDFGLAKSTATDLGLTKEVNQLGTLPYMPPEQVDPSLGAFSAATDVYALGVTLYEALTGLPPLPDPKRPDRDPKYQIAWDMPPAPSTLNSRCPRDLDRVCLVCLQKVPHDRYPSASELAADLRRFVNGQPVEARVPGRAKLFLRRCQRRPGLVASMILLLLVATTAAVVAYTERSRAEGTTKALVTAQSRVKEVQGEKDAAESKASEASQRAAKTEEINRQKAYATDLQEIEGAWSRNEFSRVRGLLDRQTPTADAKDLRGVEWFYWDHRLRSQAITIATGWSCRAVALSSDGSRVAMSDDVRAGVWDTKTG